MSTGTSVAIVVIILIVIAIIILLAVMQSRRAADRPRRDRFGPEYDRAVHEHHDPQSAEADLAARQERVAGLHIQPLSSNDQARFAESWQKVQSHFVDDPGSAISEADRLVGEVMGARGYPVGDFEQRAADVSVDHPRVVEHYRAAHDVAMRNTMGQTNTEELRQAMVHYRTLFDDLLDGGQQTSKQKGNMEVYRCWTGLTSSQRTLNARQLPWTSGEMSRH